MHQDRENSLCLLVYKSYCRSIFKKYLLQELPSWQDLLSDGLHFNQDGNEAVYNILLAYLNENLPQFRSIFQADFDFPAALDSIYEYVYVSCTKLIYIGIHTIMNVNFFIWLTQLLSTSNPLLPISFIRLQIIRLAAQLRSRALPSDLSVSSLYCHCSFQVFHSPELFICTQKAVLGLCKHSLTCQRAARE